MDEGASMAWEDENEAADHERKIKEYLTTRKRSIYRTHFNYRRTR